MSPSKYRMAINRLSCGNTAHSKNADYIQLAIEALEKLDKETFETDACEWSVSYQIGLCGIEKFMNSPHGPYIYLKGSEPWNYCRVCGKKIKIKEDIK